MSVSVVPIVIRQHLVSFFFKESDGETARYGNRVVKSVLFSPDVSSVGRIFRLLLEKSNNFEKINNFNLYITIIDNVQTKSYQGQFYKHVNGANSILKLPEQASKDINDLLEDIFRMAFVSYVNGAMEHTTMPIVQIIDKFIDKYDLLEVNFSNDTLRRMYYREKTKKALVSRYQMKKNKKGLNAL
jgi:hypothetical protein